MPPNNNQPSNEPNLVSSQAEPAQVSATYQPQQPPVSTVQPTSTDSLQTLIPTKNKSALMSYYFGVFGLIPFFGIPLAIAAVVLGIIGLNKFKQKPTPGAKGHALTGIILGSIELIIALLFIVLIIILGVNS